MEVLWLCESLKSIGRPIRHQQKNLMCSCASGQPTESGKEARLWKGIQPFWHCAGESGYIGLFLVALLEGHWRIMDFGVTWNWLESYLYCLLNLGNSFTSEPCVWIEWDDKHKTPAHHSFSSLMIYDVVWSHWLAFPPLFRVIFFWELIFLWVAFLKFMLLKHKILSQTNDKIIHSKAMPKEGKILYRV